MIWLTLICIAALLFFALRYIFLRLELRRVAKQFPELRKAAQYGRRLYLDRQVPALDEIVREANALISDYEDRMRRTGELEKNVRLTISGLSHDIRTPLTSLTGYLQLLSKEAVLTEKQQEYLDVARSSSETLKDLTENFYELSRLEQGEHAYACENIRLDQVVYESLFSFYNNFAEKGLNVELPDDEFELFVFADETALKRILFNLIQNLLRYANGDVKVCFDTSRHSHSVIIENESAVPLPEEPERIFDRFYKVDSSRSKRGSGLGLYVSRKLAENMGGTLSASKVYGEEGIEKLRIALTLPHVNTNA